MFETIITKAISSLIIVAISVAGLFGYSPQPQMGATIPITVALFSTSLSAKITSSATSMTLVSGTDKSGDALNGYMCFIIDEGSSDEEFVCGTASSTAVSSMIRGIDPIDGDLEVSALKNAHRRGASVKATNYPQLAIISRILNGDETLPNFLEYATSAAPTLDAQLANKKYADDLAIAGAPDITYSVKGIAELATTSELIAGTATGGTSAYLVVPNNLFNQTSTATTLVPVTGSDGKLSQGFLDLTEDFTFSGANIFSATTTTNGALTASGANTLSGATTISGDLTMSGTITQSGTTTFSVIPTLPASDPTTANQAVRKSYVDSQEQLYATGATSRVINDTSNQTIAHGLGKIPKMIRITAAGGGVNTSGISVGTAVSTSTEQCVSIESSTGSGTQAYSDSSNILDIRKSDDSVIRKANLITLDATNIVLDWTTNANEGGTTYIIWEAYY